jgi:plasmid stabilization system protein ParE
VTRITYAPQAVRDLERAYEFLAGLGAGIASSAVQDIEGAISILGQHPMIGRPAEAGLRELVISRGRTGYVALYDFLEAIDTVVILAIRHQREAGFQ